MTTELAEVLDIPQVIERWDEIMDRCEVGESFVITINGEPKIRLEPIAAAAT